ncbi:hypothetical protein Hypma_005849 [Hypsizygus marmoreus]|uniref:Uncharacterized protein n=1 Tax=Hypsizygus marmoreus TaxID=39966 RepID=A0A369KD13_HYPMA|nr:hypothetical protein Hypma_005849 [Hypsizygus marmoreus]
MSHPLDADRRFRVEILQPDPARIIGGEKQCRYIIFTLPRPYHISQEPNIQAVDLAPKVWGLKRKDRDGDAGHDAATQMAARMEKFRRTVETKSLAAPNHPTRPNPHAAAMACRLESFQALLVSRHPSNV